MSGRVLQWGSGTPTPTEVGDLTDVKAIAAGAGHRLALKNDGTVWAWGANDRGQLGNGSNQARSNPVNVTGLTDVLSIAAGGQHSLAIRSDLSVWAWGANDQGQLGDGSPGDRNTPAVVPGVQAIEVAASGGHSLAITDDVRVLGWGSNAECQLGVDPRSDPFDPVVCSPRPSPTELAVPQGHRAATTGRAIAASDAASFVLASNGEVVAFGGTGDPAQYRGLCNQDLALMPIALTPLTGIKEIASGPRHTLFLKADGRVMSLGTNAAGQGGTGSTSVQNCPTEIDPALVRSARQVAAGSEHSLALVAGQSQVQPASLSFGPVQAGTSSATPLPARVTNSGLGPIGFYEISKAAEEFGFTENCPDRPALLLPGGSCEILVTFSPAATGARAGRIVIIHDGLERQQEVALTGEGVEGIIALTPTIADFGDQAVGIGSPARQFQAQNTGGAPALISSISATAGFTVRRRLPRRARAASERDGLHYRRGVHPFGSGSGGRRAATHLRGEQASHRPAQGERDLSPCRFGMTN